MELKFAKIKILYQKYSLIFSNIFLKKEVKMKKIFLATLTIAIFVGININAQNDAPATLTQNKRPTIQSQDVNDKSTVRTNYGESERLTAQENDTPRTTTYKNSPKSRVYSSHNRVYRINPSRHYYGSNYYRRPAYYYRPVYDYDYDYYYPDYDYYYASDYYPDYDYYYGYWPNRYYYGYGPYYYPRFGSRIGNFLGSLFGF